GGEGLRLFLDGAIVTAALTLVSWLTVLKGAVAAGGGIFIPDHTAPVTDILTAVVIFSALAHSRRANLSRALVGAGVLANVIGDSAIAYFGALGIVLGVELVDATWFAGSLLLGLAALAAMAERPAQDEDERAPGRWQIA